MHLSIERWRPNASSLTRSGTNAELRHLPRLLTGVSTFVDVGASVGPYTHCADGNMRDGRIIAVEANPDTFARLEAHCSNWRASSSNRLETVHAAASDRVGQLELFIPDSNQLPLLSAIFTTTGAPSEWRTVTVDCVTLDDLLADAKPDLIKVDVEGAEFRVLRETPDPERWAVPLPHRDSSVG